MDKWSVNLPLNIPRQEDPTKPRNLGEDLVQCSTRKRAQERCSEKSGHINQCFSWAYLWAQDWGYRAGLADVMAGLAWGRLMVVVMVVMSRRAENTSRDVWWARGMGRRRYSRRATMSRGGWLVVHGWEWLVVSGGQVEWMGAWGRGGGGHVRMG